MTIHKLLRKQLILYIVIFISLSIAITLSFATYNISFWPTDSASLYIPAARILFNSPFISSIHKYLSFTSLHNKEILVLGIAIFQKLLGDNTSLFPNILLLIIATGISSICLYIIFEEWFNKWIGLLAFILFSSCFWPYQYVLQGAHQPLVLMNFLISLLLIQKINKKRYHIFIGIFIGLMIYSSPTSPVYLPYLFAAIFIKEFMQKNCSILKKPLIIEILYKYLIILIGILLVVLAIILPNPIINIKEYIAFINSSRSYNNFNAPQFFFGESFPILSKRGAGISWILKYFFLIIPSIFSLYIFNIIYLLLSAVKKPINLLIIFISLSTPLCVEIIKVAQFGRNYFSWLPGIIFLICYCSYNINKSIHNKVSRNIKYSLYSVFIIFLIYNAYFNAKIFFLDVFPSRMSTSMAYNWLIKNKFSKKLYTYKNHPYFPNTIQFINEPKKKEKISFHYIKTIKDAKNGWIFIPPITGKSIWANCQISDFAADPYLTELLYSGKFQNFIVKYFKTLSSSKIWVQEEEYCTYRDLHMGDINASDRRKGYIFILDAKKLQEEWFTQNKKHL